MLRTIPPSLMAVMEVEVIDMARWREMAVRSQRL
jgi:hypothetical protein